MVIANEKDKFALERLDMVYRQLRDRGIKDEKVLEAMGQVPREEFMPSMYRFQAYSDSSVAIGMGQTISQPYIIALMTQCLTLSPNSEVLEIGTGSGYQTAILAKIAKKVYTIERLEQLSEGAQAVLGRLNFGNIEFYVGDGSVGWPQKRQFDNIIITAAAPSLPNPLRDQIKEQGTIVVPVGDQYSQQLYVYRRHGSELVESPVAEVRFVNLVGKFGFTEQPGQL